MNKVEVYGLTQAYLGLLLMVVITVTSFTNSLTRDQFIGSGILISAAGLVILYKTKKYIKL